jgi:hypothetical protein
VSGRDTALSATAAKVPLGAWLDELEAGAKLGRARLAWAMRAQKHVGDAPVEDCRRYVRAVAQEQARWHNAAEQNLVADGFTTLFPEAREEAFCALALLHQDRRLLRLARKGWL